MTAGSALKAIVYTAFEYLGLTKRKNQDWCDENDVQISSLLAEKHRLHIIGMNDLSSAIKDAE